MSSYRIEYTHYPLILIVAEGDITQAQAQEHFKEYRKLLDRGEKYAVVLDGMGLGSVDPQVRKQFAKFLADNSFDIRRLCKGTAFALSSPIARGMLTALLWIQDLPFAHKVVNSRAEGERWARGQLAEQPAAAARAE